MKLSILSTLLLVSPVVANTHRRKRLNESPERRDEEVVAVDSNDVSFMDFGTAGRQTQNDEFECNYVSPTKPSQAIPLKSQMGCPSGQRKLQMRINVDKFGAETTWEVKQKDTGKVVMKNSRTYKANDSETVERCVDSGSPEKHYELIMYDEIGDGICCRFGDGSYTLSIEEDGQWTPLVTGGNFKKKIFTSLISVRSMIPAISARDVEWLEAHNVRRKKYHEQYGKTYVPVKWSAELAESSRVYATALLDSCDDIGIIHDPDNYYGENMAKNRGAKGWGCQYTADKVTTRFVEKEIPVGYPHNYHMTQALWRPTRYVGCADAHKPWKKGTCRIQVCRYSKAGNCDVNRDTWEEKMMWDDSGCFPDCPPEGCF